MDTHGLRPPQHGSSRTPLPAPAVLRLRPPLSGRLVQGKVQVKSKAAPGRTRTKARAFFLVCPHPTSPAREPASERGSQGPEARRRLLASLLLRLASLTWFCTCLPSEARRGTEVRGEALAPVSVSRADSWEGALAAETGPEGFAGLRRARGDGCKGVCALNWGSRGGGPSTGPELRAGLARGRLEFAAKAVERCAPSPHGAAPHLGGGKRNPDWSACLRVYLATPSTLWRSGFERGHPFLLRLLRISVFKVLANIVHSYCKLFTTGSISRPLRCGCGLCLFFFFFPACSVPACKPSPRCGSYPESSDRTGVASLGD